MFVVVGGGGGRRFADEYTRGGNKWLARDRVYAPCDGLGKRQRRQGHYLTRASYIFATDIRRTTSRGEGTRPDGGGHGFRARAYGSPKGRRRTLSSPLITDGLCRLIGAEGTRQTRVRVTGRGDDHTKAYRKLCVANFDSAYMNNTI